METGTVGCAQEHVSEKHRGFTAALFRPILPRGEPGRRKFWVAKGLRRHRGARGRTKRVQRRFLRAHQSVHTALIYSGQRMSYSQLYDSSRRVASGLAGLGVEAGDRGVVEEGEKGPRAVNVTPV